MQGSIYTSFSEGIYTYGIKGTDQIMGIRVGR
jgi:hypothetical protein